MNSLFDDLEAESYIPDWREVSQAIFLSWPPSVQWQYCANRDLASAAVEDSPWHAEFFLTRAKTYLALSQEGE